MRRAAVDLVVIECHEYEHINVDAQTWLTDGHVTAFNPEIDGRDVLRANFRKGVLTLQATSYVGVIPLNERVIVRVRPRVPMANLTRMVIETGHDVLPLSALREYSSRGKVDAWTFDLYADALVSYVDDLLDRGLMRTYQLGEEEGNVPHGRIQFRSSVQRFAAKGIPNKAVYAWWQRTVDTPANRCVKAALEAVHRRYGEAKSQPRKGDRRRLAKLSGQLQAFADVSSDPNQSFLADTQVHGSSPLPDSRAYYRPILDLSKLILQGTGIALELGGNDVRLRSLLIDTNSLLENFVRVSLAKYAAAHAWPIEVLDGNTTGWVALYDVPELAPAPLGAPLPALANSDAGKAQPDVVLRSIDNVVHLVAEVKNTAHGKHAAADNLLPERGEVEQAVTYAVRYGLDFTVIIHPWFKGTKGLVYVGRVRTIDVYDYRLDLSSRGGMDASLDDMGRTLGSLAGLHLP